MPTETLECALTLKRTTKFWIVAGLAFFLSVLSWVNPFIFGWLNLHLAGQSTKEFTDEAGWVYVGLRLFPVAALLAAILSFPRTGGSNIGKNRPGTAHVKHSRFLDPLMGLRALACLMVLMGHYFLVDFQFANNGVAPIVRVLLRSSPWAGVWVFFTLSGYLMGKGFARARYSLDEAGAFLFFRNRLLRILPIYVCSILLISIYCYPGLLQIRHLWMFVEMLIFDYRGDLPINPCGALWSVSAEFQFYLLVPALMVFLLYLQRKLGRSFVALPFFALLVGTAARIWVAIHMPGRFATYVYSPMLSNLDIFVVGLSLNLIPHPKAPAGASRQLSNTFLWLSSILFYGVISAFTEYVAQHRTLQMFWAIGPFVSVPFAALFILVAERAGRIEIRQNLGGKVLLGIQGFGALTYCLYVFHPQIYMTNAGLLPSPHPLSSNLGEFPRVMLEIFALSAFFYFAVEKPFDTKKRISSSPSLLDPP